MNILAANLWALHTRAAAEVATERAASITSLILRRRYPKPVTFTDLRAAVVGANPRAMWKLPWSLADGRRWWHQSLKEVTSALDEVYAVVDGSEVRVAVVRENGVEADCSVTAFGWGYDFRALLEVADEQGYWERPHEVRLDLRTEAVV